MPNQGRRASQPSGGSERLAGERMVEPLRSKKSALPRISLVVLRRRVSRFTAPRDADMVLGT